MTGRESRAMRLSTGELMRLVLATLLSPRGLRDRRVVPVALAGASGAVAVALADGARESADLSAFDPAVTSAVVADRTPALTLLAKAVTFVGSTPALAAMTLAVLGWLLWRHRDRSAAVAVGAAMAAAAVLTVVSKHLVARARPPADLVIGSVQSDFAFPSGHTLNATVFFGLLAGLALTSVRGRGRRAAVVIAWLAATGAMGLSRIYLGQHWLTDVMASWALAVMVLSVTALVAMGFARGTDQWSVRSKGGRGHHRSSAGGHAPAMPR